MHAGNLLLSLSHHYFFSFCAEKKVLEDHSQAAGRHGPGTHANGNLVQSSQLTIVGAGYARCGQGQAMADFRHQLRCVFAQEHLAASSLPAQIVGEIDIADNVSLFESDPVTIFVVTHGSTADAGACQDGNSKLRRILSELHDGTRDAKAGSS